MIDYKMFPAIFDKIWDGVDKGLIKMDIWASFTAQERHQINKMTEGDAGEKGKEAVWSTVMSLYRRKLIDYPYVKRAYIRIDTCPSCGYDHEDTTVFLQMPYALDHIEELAKLDLDINMAIRPFYFDAEYVDNDSEFDLSDYTLFYRYSSRRAEIAPILTKASQLLADGYTIRAVSKEVGFTKQAVSDWVKKDWVAVTRAEYKAIQEKKRNKQYQQCIKDANKLFAKGLNKSEVCRLVKVSHDIMKIWIESGRVTVPTSIREQQKSEMLQMALQGQRQIDIARHFGLAQTTVSEMLRSQDEYVKHKNDKKRSQINLIKRLASKGYSAKDIAVTTALSVSSVRRIRNQEAK